MVYPEEDVLESRRRVKASTEANGSSSRRASGRTERPGSRRAAASRRRAATDTCLRVPSRPISLKTHGSGGLVLFGQPRPAKGKLTFRDCQPGEERTAVVLETIATSLGGRMTGRPRSAPPLRGQRQSAEQSKQRRLPASRTADDPEQLALGNVESDVGQGSRSLPEYRFPRPETRRTGSREGSGVPWFIASAGRLTGCPVVPREDAAFDETKRRFQHVSDSPRKRIPANISGTANRSAGPRM